MSTASFELAQSIPLRISELNVLIEKARQVETSNEALYNALCRASGVLIVSHMEGFVKDLATSIVGDLNYHLGGFSAMPVAMQRTFCKKIAYFENVPTKEVESRVKQLLVFFGRNSVEIDMKAFTYKENPNKNPSTDLIDSTFEKLGTPNILNSIAIPPFEVVFDNDIATNYRLNRDMRRFVSYLYAFPFKKIPEPYCSAAVNVHKANGGQSLWHTYVEEVMTRRHSIAHGDTLSNPTSWEELKRDCEKLSIMMFGLLYSAADRLGRTANF
jgi:hypothetical protein